MNPDLRAVTLFLCLFYEKLDIKSLKIGVWYVFVNNSQSWQLLLAPTYITPSIYTLIVRKKLFDFYNYNFFNVLSIATWSTIGNEVSLTIDFLPELSCYYL